MSGPLASTQSGGGGRVGGVVTGSTWRQRLSAYFIGVAIGCLLLGLIWNARAQRQAALRPAAAQPATAAPVPDQGR